MDEEDFPHVSKSRLMEWVKNPEHFRLKYLEEIVEEETHAMRRGTAIHETIEHYYAECLKELDRLDPRYERKALPEDRTMWADFLVPWVTNFLAWDYERYKQCDKTREYIPVAIEKEHSRDDLFDKPMMGIADCIYKASGLPEFPAEEGVVVVDFKTGSVPKEKYRDDGIYLELAYYELLMQDKYNVAGAAAYYPKEDEFLIKPDDDWYFDKVVFEIGEMLSAVDDYSGSEQFEINPGPLCAWGTDDDEESSFYGVCSQCTWAVPKRNEETFKQMVEEGYSYDRIAEELGTTTDAVGYWTYKYDL